MSQVAVPYKSREQDLGTELEPSLPSTSIVLDRFFDAQVVAVPGRSMLLLSGESSPWLHCTPPVTFSLAHHHTPSNRRSDPKLL